MPIWDNQSIVPKFRVLDVQFEELRFIGFKAFKIEIYGLNLQSNESTSLPHVKANV